MRQSDDPIDPIEITMFVIKELNSLHIPYAIVGSLASTIHGQVRSTMDSDLVVSLPQSAVSPLVSRLQNEFYADEQMALNAIQHQSSFNLIHLETMFKVDLFVLGKKPFDLAQLERRIERPAWDGSDEMIYVVSAEDTILAKLRWYRMGGETSERQWRDVEGVLKVQGERLDFEYMRGMAMQINVDDLLAVLLERR